MYFLCVLCGEEQEIGMRAIAGYLLGAVLLALIGGVCLAAGLLDRDMARAQQHLVALNYDDPDATFERAERYYEYSSRLPWVGNDALNDVRARRAALQYWQRRYAAMVPEQTDPVAGLPQDNVALQLVVANAVYRTAQVQAKDKQTTIEALDNGILAYLTVLKNATRQEDAAHNYEYLVRLREDILKGRRKPGPLGAAEPNSQHGRAGAPPEQNTDSSEFKIYVPLEADERDMSGGKAGKAAPIQRKG
jgi:hypothetical protein